MSAFRLKFHPKLRRALWIFFGITVLVGITLAVIAARIEPIIRERAAAALASRFDSEVTIPSLRVSLIGHIYVRGQGLTLRHHGRTDVPPLIEIRQFSASLNWSGLFGKPFHVQQVRLLGLVIHVPPKNKNGSAPEPRPRKEPDIPLLVDDLTADDSELDLIPGNPEKEPHVFRIHHLVMHSVGLGHSAPFESQLTNAVPPGEIDVKGHFGPWQGEDPGETPLAADYRFDHADLGVFHGISGILSSSGSFGGVLENIAVEGTTTTPDFTITVAGHPLQLTTDFTATVDGTNGDTLLHPVIARFLHSTLICDGGVVKSKDRPGREIVLDVTSDHARIEDLMQFAVKTQSPMTGDVRLKTKLDLPPGHGDITDRLRLEGTFGIGGAQFASADVQSKLESLSRRGQGKPQDLDVGSAISNLQGAFVLRDGQLTFEHLTFSVTGATVDLAGTYGLKTEEMDFHGKLHLQAPLSEITTGVKSFLLKPFDPFFRKNGETVLPIRITGRRDQPSFGLDFHHKSEHDESRQNKSGPAERRGLP
jgi:AsmA-like C-terminal region